MNDVAIRVENLSKYYKLGVINSGTLSRDLQSWLWKKVGKEDPNKKIDTIESDADGFWALKDLNFEIKKGDRVGIIGRNGAGKSTLLKMISQISSPTTGKIYIDGKIASLLEVGTGFNPELTGRENIYLNGAILGMKRKEVDRKIDEIIAFSEIETHIDTPVKRYSSGMYVRLAFAVAAHLDSEILIADEVLAVGDAAFQKKALGKMNELSTGDGRTVLFVSHNMAQIRQLCNKGVVLEKGKVIYNGDIETSIVQYLNTSKFDLKCQYNLFEGEHCKDFVSKLQLLKFSFLNKENPIFSYDEKMVFELQWKSLIDVNDVLIRIVIVDSAQKPVGMAKSDIPIQGKKDEVINTVFQFDCANLAPGTYNFELRAFSINENGILLNYDAPNTDIYFTIQDSDINWDYRWWGNVRLSKLELLEKIKEGKNEFIS